MITETSTSISVKLQQPSVLFANMNLKSLRKGNFQQCKEIKPN